MYQQNVICTLKLHILLYNTWHIGRDAHTEPHTHAGTEFPIFYGINLCTLNISNNYCYGNNLELSQDDHNGEVVVLPR